MIVRCPKCQMQLTLDMKHLDEDTALVCRGCRSILKTKIVVEILVEKGASPSLPPAAPKVSAVSEATPRPSPPPPSRFKEEPRENVPPAAIDSEKVLVAIDGEGTKDLIKELLSGAGFKVVEASSGKEILPLLARQRPAVALIDVGLPDGLGSDFCGMIKKDPRLKDTVVILMASIYEKNNKYRRQPSSLFGADDYIERHHVQKDLLIRIRKHLNRTPVNDVPVEPLPAETSIPSSFGETSQTVLEETVKPPDLTELETSSPAATDEEISFAEKPKSAPVLEESARSITEPVMEKMAEPKEHKDARRLARIIVSDIVLYNKKKVDEGIRSGTFYELLKEEIEEGKKHYDSRVPPEVQKVRDFYKEAFEDFINKRKGLSA